VEHLAAEGLEPRPCGQARNAREPGRDDNLLGRDLALGGCDGPVAIVVGDPSDRLAKGRRDPKVAGVALEIGDELVARRVAREVGRERQTREG
jgi:hypothetical protein